MTTFAFDLSGNTVTRSQSSGNASSPSGYPRDVAIYDGYGMVSADVASANISTSRYRGTQDRYNFTAGYSIGFGGQFGYYTEGNTKLSSGAGTEGDRGLILATHRYYDPINARWLTRDPIGYDGDINLYGYAGGNPVMFADADGLEHHVAQVFLYFNGSKTPAFKNFMITSGAGGANILGGVTRNLEAVLNGWLHTERGFLLALMEKQSPGSAQSFLRNLSGFKNVTVNGQALIDRFGLTNVNLQGLSKVKFYSTQGMAPCGNCAATMRVTSEGFKIPIDYHYKSGGQMVTYRVLTNGSAQVRIGNAVQRVVSASRGAVFRAFTAGRAAGSGGAFGAFGAFVGGMDAFPDAARPVVHWKQRTQAAYRGDFDAAGY